MHANPRVGNTPLFPSPANPEKPIGRERAAKWLLKAEKLAGQPKLAGGVFHPYRRLWATERKNLPDTDVAQAGGWAGHTRPARVVQHADPVTLLRVVEHATG